MNILIVSYSFHPNPNIAAKRFSEMVPHLLRAGCCVEVITVKTQGDSGAHGLIDGIRLHEVGKPIKIGLNRITKTSPNEGLSKPVIFLRRLVRCIGIPTTVLDRHIWEWFLPAVKYVKDRQKDFKHIDIIVGSCGPFSSLLIARHLSKQLGKPWVADYRDLIIETANISCWNQRLCYFIEKRATASCAGCITVSPTLTKITNRKLGKPAGTVFNGLRDELIEEFRQNKTEQIINSQKYAYYAGRFYEHQMESVKRCLIAFKDSGVTLRIRSLGPGFLEEELDAFARQNDVIENLDILAPASETVVDKEASKALFNLVFEDLNTLREISKGTLTGKFLRLLAVRRPILVVARKDSDMNLILEDTGKGRIVETVAEIKGFLNDVESGFCFLGKEERVLTYSKGRQAILLLEFLERFKGKDKQKKY